MNKNTNTITCISHNENALIFNASGIEGFIVESSSDFLSKVKEHIKNGVKIIIVSDVFTNEVNELRAKYNEVYPIFLILNLDGSITGDGVESIRNDVERATGINLF